MTTTSIKALRLKQDTPQTSCQDSLCASCCFWQTFSNQLQPEGCVWRSKTLHRTEGNFTSVSFCFHVCEAPPAAVTCELWHPLLVNRDHLMRPIERNLLTTFHFHVHEPFVAFTSFTVLSWSKAVRHCRRNSGTDRHKKQKKLHASVTCPSFEKRSSIL